MVQPPKREEPKQGGTLTHKGTPKKKGGSAKQNERVAYAWEISKDLDFLALLEAENGLWTEDRKSMIIGKNGYYDIGICQINAGYFPHIVQDPRFFKDWKWQIEQCYSLYKNGTKFYGRKNIHRTRSHFIF